MTKTIILPPLISHPNQLFSFEIEQAHPNYITLLRVQGEVLLLNGIASNIRKKIVLIESADPGYDWIFTHDILGFITMYGGLNSHMSIRATELGIPAVIGVGAILFSQFTQAQILDVDCENKMLRIIK